MNNFDEANSTRYAQMQSTLNNKTSFSQQQGSPGKNLNLTGKFSFLEQLTHSIEGEAYALTAAARESSRVVDQMKRVVAEKELGEYRSKCWEEVKKYEKSVKYGVSQNERRTEQMQSKCKSLSQSTEQMKQVVTLLHTRINKLENVLGYYNGAEIVSNY